MRLPGRDEALGILRGAGCSRGVVSHCERVVGGLTVPPWALEGLGTAPSAK